MWGLDPPTRGLPRGAGDGASPTGQGSQVTSHREQGWFFQRLFLLPAVVRVGS